MVDQTTQFYAILTNVGAAKQANADALGIAWKITEMAVGDGNPGNVENPALPQPSANWTALLNEWRRAPLNQLKVDDKDSSIIVAEQIIPADIGGRWIREIGLYDADGDLVAVANCAPTYKPLLNQGSGRTQVVRMNLIVSSASNVQLKIDPSVVLATREWVTTGLAGKVNVADKATKALAEAGIDDSSWMTALGVFQSALKRLNSLGLATNSAPKLSTFEAVTPAGLYLAFAGGNANPTPGGPPSDRNSQLGVIAVTPRSDCTYYIAVENGVNSAWRRVWFGQYNIINGVPSMYWSSAITSDQIATQAQVESGLVDDVVVTPKKMRWGFAVSLAVNGYVIFPTWLGGLVIQWGGFNTPFLNNATTDYTITWPVAFPKAVYLAHVQTIGGVDSGSGANVAVYAKTTTSGMVRATKSGPSSYTSNPFSWFAIGA